VNKRLYTSGMWLQQIAAFRRVVYPNKKEHLRSLTTGIWGQLLKGKSTKRTIKYHFNRVTIRENEGNSLFYY